ncbi:hypothetical protein GCM10008936_08300 [Alkalibacterium indicireducens]|uniref:Uncharacterized protein n=1 Tax=Alkalibacterium indicireducens TaxID=398758 RepID=A0ABN1ANS1_9LACT
MKNSNNEKERYCLTCGKTITSPTKISICKSCINRGKQFSLATGLGIVKKNSNK